MHAILTCMKFSKMAVVVNQHHGFKAFTRSQRCRLQSFTHLENTMFELSQTNLAHSLKQAFEVANIHKSFSTPCLSLATNSEEDLDASPRIEIIGGRGASSVRALVAEVAIAMASGADPVRASTGLGGAYFLDGQKGNTIAVAKPVDEEPLALNNPKGFVGRALGQPGLKRSVRVGETGVRELAAYLLDHGGFAGVPPTGLVKISHSAFHINNAVESSTPPFKIASIQRFVDHDFDAGELGSSGFSVASIHQIGILDVRLLNLDRHAGNILVKKHERENYAVGAAELVPIDHGLCLPEWLDDPYFEWLHWPQASVPFSESEAEYISNLDPFKDAELLRCELPLLGESSVRVLVLCTIFLKQAVAAGLCLADIGEMMTRESCSAEQKLSVLENLCTEAKASLRNIFGYDDDGDEREDEIEEEIEMFQFDSECENGKQVLDLPQLLNSPTGAAAPPKSPRFSIPRSKSLASVTALSPLQEEVNHNSTDENDNGTDTTQNDGGSNEDESRDGRKVGGFMKSMSFSVQNRNHETGGISFGEMSEVEWKLFLECFEKLLPQAFEDTKNMGLRQRLGTSCRF